MMLSSLAVPLLFILPFALSLMRRGDPYGSLTLGAKDGLHVMLRIFPALAVLLSAMAAFEASGALQFLTGAASPVLELLGIPPQTAPLILTRPFSGSAALAVGGELMSSHGPDSFVGRTAAVMLGSTETTFYTLAVYSCASGIKPPAKTVLCALIGDLAGFVSAPLCVRLFLGQ